MKHVLKIAAIAMLVTLYCGCRSVVFSPEVDNILAKVKQTRDPQGKLPSMQSVVIRGEFRSDTKGKPMKMELAFKKPEKLRVTVVIPGKEAFVKAYNGQNAWLYTTGKGVKELKGQQLQGIKFQAALLRPGADLSKVFDSIKLKGESVEVGQKCYKFVCTPKAEYNLKPITFYVSKKSMLIVKREETQIINGDHEVALTTIFNDYQPVDGILVARNIVSYREGNLMEFNVKSVEWNAGISDSSFDPPKPLK